LSAAAASAINRSAGRTQADADDDAASGAGTTGASISAGAGLPAKAVVAAIANAVARAIFFILLPHISRNTFFVSRTKPNTRTIANIREEVKCAIISYKLENF
jgi:hypothetical protein